MNKLGILAVGMAISIAGFVWLLYLDWRIAIAVLLMLYGNAITNHADES